jgi:hypothetical protein
MYRDDSCRTECVSRRVAALPLAAILALGATAHAAEPGDVSFPFMLGTNVYTHRFGVDGYSATDTTIANSFQLSEFPGAGVFVLPRLRLGLNFQFTEAITNPPAASAFTVFGLLPQINYNFWGPLTASLVPSFYARLAGQNQFGFAVQGVFSAALPLGRGFSGVLALEIPVYVTPYVSIGFTPLIGFSYHLQVHRRPKPLQEPLRPPPESQQPPPPSQPPNPPPESQQPPPPAGETR